MEEHKKKHHKEMQDLWEEIENREPAPQKEHRDFEEEALKEDSEEEKEEE